VLDVALPGIPEGDVVALGRFEWRAVRAWGDATERADRFLRQWPVAVLSLLALAVALWVAMMAGVSGQAGFAMTAVPTQGRTVP
jgi:hypothetical protein